MPRFVVSACLAGVPCRYDGKAKSIPDVIQLVEEHKALPLCPEVLAGLGVPRCCIERLGNQIRTKAGDDMTEALRKGAITALHKAKDAGCTIAILKQRSPSCGAGQIYDGTFTGTLVTGDGMWTELLRQAGFRIITDEDLPLSPALLDASELNVTRGSEAPAPHTQKTKDTAP